MKNEKERKVKKRMKTDNKFEEKRRKIWGKRRGGKQERGEREKGKNLKLRKYKTSREKKKQPGRQGKMDEKDG